MTSTNRRAIDTFLQAPYWTRTPESLSFRDILSSINVVDKHKHTQTDTSTDNKGRFTRLKLSLAAREPIHYRCQSATQLAY